MKSEIKEYSLTDIYEISSGLSKPASAFGSGFPFLSFKDVFNNYFLPQELDQLVKSSDIERERGSIKRGDVFITRTSETMHELGMTSVALKDYENATFNGFTKRLRVKDNLDFKIYPEYMGYCLRSPWFRTSMLAFSTMSTRASLNNEMIGRLIVKIPSFEIQKKIAKILKDLDDKIAINTKINQTLEAMAQALFKSWFVDFDPVKAKMNARAEGGNDDDVRRAAIEALRLPKGRERASRPPKGGERVSAVHDNDELSKSPLGDLGALADMFPERLMESELGLIPEGWEVKALDQIANYLNGLALQKYRPEPDEIGLPVLKIAQLNKGIADGEERATAKIKQEYIVNNGDVIFSWSGSLMVDVWCGGTVALNQHLFKVSSELYPKWYYLCYTKYHLEEFQRIASAKAVTMGHIKREHLSQALCIVPDEPVFKMMNSIF